MAIEKDDNELLTLEIIHRYVELLDKYFGSVCTISLGCKSAMNLFLALLNLCFKYFELMILLLKGL